MVLSLEGLEAAAGIVLQTGPLVVWSCRISIGRTSREIQHPAGLPPDLSQG
jgi:hypothetical protein